jgi:hypothetical protein
MGIELPEITATEFADRLSACCEGLVTPLLIERLMIHYRELRRWNRMVSLVGPTSRDEVVERHGVSIVGFTNYPSMVAADASAFYGRNLLNLLDIMIEKGESGPKLKDLAADDITAAMLMPS